MSTGTDREWIEAHRKQLHEMGYPVELVFSADGCTGVKMNGCYLEGFKTDREAMKWLAEFARGFEIGSNPKHYWRPKPTPSTAPAADGEGE